MRKIMLIVISFVMSLFFVTNTKALSYSSSELKGRKTCSKFELAIAKTDGSIQSVSCHEDYTSAKASMSTNNEKNLIIIDESVSNSKIVDAKYALLYLSHGDAVTYMYSNAACTSQDNYMNNGSGYGGVEAALISYDSSNGSYKMKIGGYTGYIKKADVVAVVPVSWVKSTSYFKITSSDIYHYFAKNIENSGYTQMSYRLGPKPSNINTGSYYSYDGNYFYSSLYTMLDDYRGNNTSGSINKDNPYYNYYQYLPHRTKTNYTIDDFDAYIRNQLGMVGSIYGKKKVTNYSVLYGEADSFINSEKKFGANALSMFSLSLNESTKGTSEIARYKNNIFGHSAYDSTPFSSASVYLTVSHNIDYHAYSYISYGYSNPSDSRYYGGNFGNKRIGMNRMYASDIFWGEKAASYYYEFDRSNGMKDYDYYQLIVSNDTYIYARVSPSSSAKSNYTIKYKGMPFVLLEEVEGENYKGSNIWYKIQADPNVDSNGNKISGNSSNPPAYNWNGALYVPSSMFIKVNNTEKVNNKYHAPASVNKETDDYTYTFCGTNTVTNYKIGYLIKDTDYYYSSTMLNKKGTLKANSFVTIIKEAKNEDTVNYLVITNYGTYQKHWISGEYVTIVNRDLLKVSIDKEGSYISSYASIGGAENLKIYTYNQLPIVDYTTQNNKLYLKVQISNDGSIKYGYIDSTISNITYTTNRTKLNDKAPVINATDKDFYINESYNILDNIVATDTEDGDITSNIKVTSNNINISKVGTYSVTYSVTDSYSNTVTKTIKVNVIYKDYPPVINASDKSIVLNTTFDPLSGVTGTDTEDGNITSNIRVTSNNVNMSKVGTYSVTYSLTDSGNNTTTKTVTIKVFTYEESPGLFMFDSFKHKENNTFTISGFMSVAGMDNKTVTHELIFVNENDNKEYKYTLNNWKDYPYEMNSLDDDREYNYSGGWFKSDIDLSSNKLPNGDYKLYIKVTNGIYISKAYFTNVAYKDMARRIHGDNREFMIEVDYGTLNSPLQFSVRDNLISLDIPTSMDPMYNFIKGFNNDNGLYLKGISYNIGVPYNSSSEVSRYLVLENTTTYKRYSYPMTAITGDYLVTLNVSDNYSKKYAWFEVNVPLENINALEKGTYAIYISSNVNNKTYYGELKDVAFMDLKFNKTSNYEIVRNNNKRMRIELVVK